MKRFFLAMVMCLCLAATSHADTVFYTNSLTANSPTFHATGTSTAGSGVQFYHQQGFTVDTSGNYTFEVASPNANGTPSSALDTFIIVYANAFNPAAPGASLAQNDDFTGTLTVLPGPFGPGVTSASTGFTGAQPGSRLASVALTAGTQYFAVTTSFRDTTFVVTTGTTAQATGTFFSGITGPGIISLQGSAIPEPTSFALLGLCGMGMLVRRKRA